MENLTLKDDLGKEEEFDYNSVLVREEEDTDSEEFVNIVISEITEELSNDETKRSEFLNTVHLLTPSLHRENNSNSLNLPSGNLDVDYTDDARLNLSVDTLSVPVEQSSNISPPVRRRSLPFFNRRAKSTSSLKKSAKVNSPDLNSRNSNNVNSGSNNKNSAKSKFKNWLESSSSEKRNKQQQPRKQLRIAEPVQTDDYSTMNGVTPHTPQRNASFSISPYQQDSIDSDGGNVADTESESHEWDNISQKNVEIEMESNPDEDKEPMGQTTSLLNANKVCSCSFHR